MRIAIVGTEFAATPEAVGAFRHAQRGHPAADDLGPFGQVVELEAFAERTAGLRCLIDVGANFGIFSLVFTHHSDAVAYAVEPSDTSLRVLEENCRLNPGRRIVPMQIFLGLRGGREVRCSMNWKHVVPVPGDLVMTEHRIDDLGLDPDCIKIDVEGHEGAILRGARETIARCRPLIFLEVHYSNLTDGETIFSLMDLIHELGYQCANVGGELLHSFEHRGGMQRVICTPE